MSLRRWLLMFLALFLGGWLLFDGGRALVTGDYTTPSSGEYAGQLGPWAPLVDALGLPPRSTAMKLVFVALGGAWLAGAGGYLAGARRRSAPTASRRSRRSLILLGLATLWYLPFGTLTALGILFLLWLDGRGRLPVPAG